MSDQPDNASATAAKDVEEVEMTEEDEAAAGEGGNVHTALMTNPALIAAVQDKLNGMVGQRSGYIDLLPKVVKRRIKALKKLQAEAVKSEARFYEEVHELEVKYAGSYQKLFERRRDILNGAIEPTDSDCEWPSDEEEEEEKEAGDEKKEDEAQKTAEELAKVKQHLGMDEDAKGIPDFWLTIFKNVDMLSDMVQEYDEPILRKLEDIKVQFQSSPSAGFTLEFAFGENEYFTNSVLTKRYNLRIEPDEKDPLSYEGPEIVSCSGCKVDWKSGKNVTVKTVKKKQKHKGRGQTRVVTKTVNQDSFFNFFSPPEATEDDEEEDEETEALLSTDYEIGHFLRERVVPRAVLYFTGDALEDDEDDDEYGDDEEGEDDDDDENDPDFDPNTQTGEKPPDCKNQ